MSDVRVRLPKAQARCLKTAKEHGYVMIDGAFSGLATAHNTQDANGYDEHEPGFNADTARTVFDEGFDSKTMVEKCYALGYLKLGRYFNQYVLTDLGEAMAS